jgi:hypothetical protein
MGVGVKSYKGGAWQDDVTQYATPNFARDNTMTRDLVVAAQQWLMRREAGRQWL